MEERATGIILRTRPLTETSLIVQWLTREHGRVATVAKGARRPKSPFAGKLDLFYEADLSFARSGRSDLHALREASLRAAHPGLRRDLSRLSAAAYFAVLIEQGSERETPIPEWFELLDGALRRLDAGAPDAGLVFSFELRFLELSGVTPPLSGLSPEARELVTRMSPGLAIARGGQIEISAFLRQAVGMSLGRLPPQRERLMQILAGAL